MDARIWNRVNDLVMAADLDSALVFVASELGGLEWTDYHQVIDQEFTNDPSDVASDINDFVGFCSESFDVAAVYLEMNGFYANPNCWYYDTFGYSSYSAVLDNLDWLSSWQSGRWWSATLEGMESLQEIYARDLGAKGKPAWLKKAIGLSDLLVMLKFMRLIHKALIESQPCVPIPVLCAAHGYDIVYRHTLSLG